MKRILVCGERSFVASGLIPKLVSAGFEVETFSRGTKGRNGNSVSGDVFKMSDNEHFANEYDVVINFIIISSFDIAENLDYARSLHEFCEQHHVKQLLQISSISVYPNSAHYVDEESEIEKDEAKKGVYAAMKAAVDNFLMTQTRSYDISFLRPGLIISAEREMKFGGIVKELFPGFGILMGNKDTALPLVRKEQIHEAIIRILGKEHIKGAYLLLENRGGTKRDFVKKYYRGITIPLPKGLTLFAARVLKLCKVFSSRQVEMVRGLFKATYFDSGETEFDLQMSFSENSVAVIGSGVYGSYTVNRLVQCQKQQNVTLFDVGGYPVKDEESAGYASNIIGRHYSGLSKGRFFGFGGASDKWGGGILLFTENDFKHPNAFLHDIVGLNKKYATKVFREFKIDTNFVEPTLPNGLFIKNAVWLGYFSRNLFKYFKVNKKPIFIKGDCRVSRFIYDAKTNRVLGLEYIDKHKRIKHAFYNQYFLCAGAFESNRIILSSGMSADQKIPFSDHLSMRMFDVQKSTRIGDVDFQYGVKGSSLIVKRFVGEVNDVSFFALPIMNEHFPFFQNLKDFLFHGNRSLKIVWSIFKDIPGAIAFAWNLAIMRRIYVYKKKWSFTVDIENPASGSYIKLSTEKDSWGMPKLDVDFRVGSDAQSVFETARSELKAYFQKCNIDVSDCTDQIHAEKSEDTYHPYGMFLSDCKSVDDYFNRFPNLLVVNTGILPRAGGINCTGACLPLIDEYVDKHVSKLG